MSDTTNQSYSSSDSEISTAAHSTVGLISSRTNSINSKIPEQAKESPRNQFKRAKEGIKLSPKQQIKSLTTVDKAKNTKEKIRPIQRTYKRVDPNKVNSSSGIRTNSPMSVKKEIHEKVTQSPRVKKKPVKTTAPNSYQSPHKGTTILKGGRKSQSRPLLKEKVKTVLSKDSSRRDTHGSIIRDSIFGNYPFDSSLYRSSVASIVSPMSLGSTGFWGRHQVRMLKTQTKKTIVPTVVRSRVKAKPKGSLIECDTKVLDLTLSDLGSETEIETESESPLSKFGAPAEEEKDHRSAFLQIFQNLPDVNDISSRESLDNGRLSDLEPDFKYVQPVDQFSYESGHSISSDEEMETVSLDQTKASQSSDISFDGLTESELETHTDLVVLAKPQVEDIYIRMMNIGPKTRIIGFETSSTSSMHEPRLESYEEVEDFLVDIINQAVDYAEKPSVYLGRVLDTKKLMMELSELSVDYQDTLKHNATLEQIITEYYIRRKELGYVRAKADDSINRSRLMRAIDELDCNLEREKETQRVTHNLLAELTEKEKIARSSEVEKVEKFETMVRETLFKEGYNRLKNVTNDLLRQMNNVRDELSKSRLELTFVNHQLASMKNKSEELKNLDNGQGAQDFLSSQAVVTSLSEKILEKDAELQRLNDRVTYDVHAMAHLKNKEKMNQSLLQEMKVKLNLQMERRKKLRDLLHAGMLRRNSLKNETKDLQETGCLLHYPDMLRDYDATEEYLHAKKQVVRELKAEFYRLERRVGHIEGTTARIDRSKRSTSIRLSKFGIDPRQTI